jgi:hypothetical protein
MPTDQVPVTGQVPEPGRVSRAIDRLAGVPARAVWWLYAASLALWTCGTAMGSIDIYRMLTRG